MRLKVFILLASWVVMPTVGSQSTDAAPLSSAVVDCPSGGGFGSQPVVPTALIAKKIYSAIAPIAHARIIQSKRHFLSASDEGDHWTVSSESSEAGASITAKTHDDSETITVQSGGGTLEMEIRKCDGAVKMYFSR